MSAAMKRLERETDPAVLRQAVRLLDHENQKLAREVVRLTEQLAALKGEDQAQLGLRIAELEQQLAVRNKLLFGDSSERRSAHSSGGDSPGQRAKRRGHGPRPQPQLPIVEQHHELDEADWVCPACGGQLEPWDGQSEDSEEIDVIERRFVIHKHRRQKYRCQCGGCIETAPGPLKLFVGARYSVDFAIEVAVGKYLDHLPLERQVRMMRREGLVVDSPTLWDQLHRLAQLLTPGYEALLERVLGSSVIGVDETHWKLLGAKGRKKTQRWQAWAATDGHSVVYQIHDSRSAEAASKLLDGYQGLVMCDGYVGYQSLAKSYPEIDLVHCWAQYPEYGVIRSRRRDRRLPP